MSQRYAGTKADAARAFLSEQRHRFAGIDVTALQLLQTRQLGSRTFVRFQQQIEGVPVRGAQAVIAACTEVPMVLSPDTLATPTISSTDAIVLRTVEFARRN